MNLELHPPAPAKLLPVTEDDRVRLGEALQSLLAHGSILGLEPGSGELYAWCRQTFDWVREIAALAGLDVRMEHESRLIQAVPEHAGLTICGKTRPSCCSPFGMSMTRKSATRVPLRYG